MIKKISSIILLVALAVISLSFSAMGATAQTLTAALLLLGSAALVIARRYKKVFFPRFGGTLLGIGTLAVLAAFLIGDLKPSEEFNAIMALFCVLFAMAGPVVQLIAPSQKTLLAIQSALKQIKDLEGVKTEMEEKVKQKDADLKQKDADLTQKEADFTEATNRANTAETDLKATQDSLQNVSNELATSNTALETAETERDTALNENSVLKEKVEEAETRAAKAEFTSLAGSAQVTAEYKEAEYHDAVAAAEAGKAKLAEAEEAANNAVTAAESANSSATAKRKIAMEYKTFADSRAVVAEEATLQANRLRRLARGAVDEEAADAEIKAAKLVAESKRASGIAHLSDLDATAAERRAKFLSVEAESKTTQMADMRASIVKDEQQVTVKLSELEEAKVAAAAEALRCKFVADAEIKIVEADAKNNAADETLKKADRMLREAKRSVSLAKAEENKTETLYNVEVEAPQDVNLFVGVYAVEINEVFCRRILAGSTLTEEPVTVEHHGHTVTLVILEVHNFELSSDARERYDAPDELPPYSIGPVGKVKIN